jgi:hypothetical protein
MLCAPKALPYHGYQEQKGSRLSAQISPECQTKSNLLCWEGCPYSLEVSKTVQIVSYREGLGGAGFCHP